MRPHRRCPSYPNYYHRFTSPKGPGGTETGPNKHGRHSPSYNNCDYLGRHRSRGTNRAELGHRNPVRKVVSRHEIDKVRQLCHRKKHQNFGIWNNFARFCIIHRCHRDHSDSFKLSTSLPMWRRLDGVGHERRFLPKDLIYNAVIIFSYFVFFEYVTTIEVVDGAGASSDCPCGTRRGSRATNKPRESRQPCR